MVHPASEAQLVSGVCIIVRVYDAEEDERGSTKLHHRGESKFSFDPPPHTPKPNSPPPPSPRLRLERQKSNGITILTYVFAHIKNVPKLRILWKQINVTVYL